MLLGRDMTGMVEGKLKCCTYTAMQTIERESKHNSLRIGDEKETRRKKTKCM
jgi:hypothetical protein